MQNNCEFINNKLKKILFLLMILAISACGNNNSSSAPTGESALGGSDGDGGGTTVTVGTVTVTAGSAQVSVGGTTIVTATVLDTDGNSVPDGTVVTFSLGETTYGSLSDTPGTITATASTSGGQATVTFTASSTNAGTAVVTATAGDVSSTVNIAVIGAVGSVEVTATPAEVIVATGQSSVSATVLDTDGGPVASGTQVTFSVDNSALGTITPNANTDDNGIARATFTAGSSTAGVVTVTATAGGRSSTVQIAVNGAETGSIFFTSADPSVIGIKRVGQGEFSTIKFAIKDINGYPVLDGEAIDVCLLVHPSGDAGLTGLLPVDGGEYINEDDNVIEGWTDANGNGCYDTGEAYDESNDNGRYDSPFHATVSTVDGEATVYLHSGIQAGTVTLLATVVDTGISSVTSILSIGGGIPNYASFSVAARPLNVEGFELFYDITSEITVGVADRFGNSNVLEGTTVSFMTEAGAIPSANTLDSNGITTVTFRTQRQFPKDVVPQTWETLLFKNVSEDYGIKVPCLPPDPLPDPLPDLESTDLPCIPLDPMPDEPVAGQPRDGLLSITVSINGEEAFVDCDGNGVYDDADVDCDKDGTSDEAEPFTDTPDEIFIDYNDNETCDDATGLNDPVELYQDKNGNGVCDDVNGQWDEAKTLFRMMPLLYTGKPYYYRFSVLGQNIGDCTNPSIVNAWSPPGSFTICDGESFQFKVLVSDRHLNPLLAGTTIKVAATGDVDLFGMTEVKILDTSTPGPVEMFFFVSDKTPDDTDPPKPFTLTVTVTWKGDKYENPIRGLVD